MHDLDFAMPNGAIRAARLTADSLGGDFYALDTQRDTGRVLLRRSGDAPLVLDFAAFRGPDLNADLHDRDFTINAIAINLNSPDRLIDPLGGAADLRLRRLRICSPNSFLHDPVRILRAVRLAVDFRLRIEPNSLRLLREATPRLIQVSNERVRDEFFRILDGAAPSAALRLLAMLGALEPVFPELAALENTPVGERRNFNGWEKALDRLQRLTRLLQVLQLEHDPETAGNWAMGIAALRLGRFRRQLYEHLSVTINPNRTLKSLTLFAGMYPETSLSPLYVSGEGGRHLMEAADIARQRALDLRLSNIEVERVYTIVHNTHRLEIMAKGALGDYVSEGWKETQIPLDPALRTEIYRFFRDVGPAGVEICLLWLADALSSYGTDLPQETWVRQLNVARALLESWWEYKAERISPPALIGGRDLMDFLEMPAGPEVGRLLEEIRTSQAAGLVTDRDQALDLARTLMRGAAQG